MEMEMPKPGPGHQKLAQLAGRWSGDETLHPSPMCPEGGKATATMTTKVGVDGFYVVGDYEQKRGGVVTFRGHSVFGFDESTQEASLWWFDSSGMTPDAFRGKFEGSKLALACANPMGHFRIAYDFSEKGSLRTRMEFSQDGKQWSPMFDGVYHREG